MNRHIAAGLFAAVLASAAGVHFGQRFFNSAAPAPTLATAELLRSVRLNDVEGHAQALGQWPGKTLVINFWATWCAPCIEELPELSQAQAQFAASGVQFVGIAVDSSANVRRYLDHSAVAYPLLVGEASAIELSRQFGNSALALPYTIIVDRNGVIRASKLGRISRSELEASLLSIAPAT